MSYGPPPGATPPPAQPGPGGGPPGPPGAAGPPRRPRRSGQPGQPAPLSTGWVLLLIAAALNVLTAVAWVVTGIMVYDREWYTKVAFGWTIPTAVLLVAGAVLLLVRLRAGSAVTLTGAIFGVLGAPLAGITTGIEDNDPTLTIVLAIIAGALGVAAFVLVRQPPLRAMFRPGRPRPAAARGYGPPGAAPPGSAPPGYGPPGYGPPGSVPPGSVPPGYGPPPHGQPAPPPQQPGPGHPPGRQP